MAIIKTIYAIQFNTFPKNLWHTSVSWHIGSTIFVEIKRGRKGNVENPHINWKLQQLVVHFQEKNYRCKIPEKKTFMMQPCWTMKEKGAAIENHSINAKRMLDTHNMEAHVKYIKYMEMPFNIWLEHVNNRVLQFVCVPYKVSQKWWTLTTNTYHMLSYFNFSMDFLSHFRISLGDLKTKQKKKWEINENKTS